jgi:exosortase/archaeosortase family protein
VTNPPSEEGVVGSHSAFDRGFTGLLILYAMTIYFYSRRVYVDKNKRLRQFILRLAAFITLGYGVALILPTWYLQKSLPALATSVFSILDITSVADGENLYVAIKEGGFYLIVVSPFCVGWGPISNYVALILSVPMISGSKRLKAVLIGIPVVGILNFLKILLEGLIVYYYGTQPWVGEIDIYLSSGLLILVYLVWSFWIGKNLEGGIGLKLKFRSANPNHI